MEDAVKLMVALGQAAARGLSRRHPGGGAAGRPHAADLHRSAGRQRRHRAALRPSRQAARDEGLGRGHGAVDPGAQGRQALWPRRRRRRLCDLCLPVRAQGARRAEGAARALRHHDRGLRGKRQLRPAVLRRSPDGAHRQAVAGGLPRFGLRRLGPAVAHDIAARHCRRDAHRAGADRGRPFGRRLGHRALLLPHHARAAVAPRGRGHGRDQAARRSMSRSRRSASSRPRRRRACWASRSTPSSRSPDRRGRWPTIWARWC